MALDNKIYTRHLRSGFTLVEVLAALVLLAVLVPVVSQALGLSSRAAAISERSAIATELAQNKLEELVVSQSLATSQQSGDFGKENPGYRWELIQNTWAVYGMTELTIKVYFDVQGTTRDISLTTLVNPVTATTSTTTTTSAP